MLHKTCGCMYGEVGWEFGCAHWREVYNVDGGVLGVCTCVYAMIRYNMFSLHLQIAKKIGSKVIFILLFRHI